MTIQPVPVQTPDLELRASCDLLGIRPGGIQVKVTIGFARTRRCHACEAAENVAHGDGCEWWSERGMGLPQYAGNPDYGYRPLKALAPPSAAEHDPAGRIIVPGACVAFCTCGLAFYGTPRDPAASGSPEAQQREAVRAAGRRWSAHAKMVAAEERS